MTLTIGIIGKPSSGKTTFLNAACLTHAKVSEIPFTTIDPNKGVAYVKNKCACKELNVNSLHVFSTIDTPDEIAYKKLKIIIKAINQGWQPDWNNKHQYKYFPWFNMVSSDSGISYYLFGSWTSESGVCSKLCFESLEKCEYTAKQFTEIYNDYLTIK